MAAPTTITWSEADEKKAIEDALNNIPDIRQTYAEDEWPQTWLLARTHPAMYDANTVREMLQRDGSNEPVVGDMRAIDLSIVLARFLWSFVGIRLRQYPDTRSPDPEQRRMAENEEGCLLAQLIWKDYETDEQRDVNKEKAQSILRWCAARQIAKCLGYDRVEDLRFIVVYHRRANPKSEWTLLHPDAEFLQDSSKDSLIKWDGTSDLQAILHRKFGLAVSSDETNHWLYETNTMEVVRMWYTPNPEARRTFDELKKLRFTTYRLERLGGGQQGNKGVQGVQDLVVAAIVHFRRKNGKGDALRMWTLDGAQARVEEGLAYLEDDEWRMGAEDEGEYMLYYVQAPTFPLQEIVECTPRKRSWREQNEAIRNAGMPASENDDNEVGGGRGGRGGLWIGSRSGHDEWTV
ncbi:hypothetical protein PG997_015200 [Apiospora hydei]|uniref:Uncharacterized protein n=1 Tax=Apiospora hydei TaxID=1337664 RepID=A0ABR1UW12_9PEZI